jgi:hypothetical protein
VTREVKAVDIEGERELTVGQRDEESLRFEKWAGKQSLNWVQERRIKNGVTGK